MAITRGDGHALTAEVIDRCRRIPTATWSDALDDLGIAGVVDGLAMRSGRGRIAGSAITVQEEVGELGTFTLDRFDIGGIISATPPGSIPVIAMNSGVVSTFGGLSAHAAVRRGIPGLVIDGACRDLEDIQKLGLYLAARHITPRSGKRRINVVAIGGRVACGGVQVRTGDCVVADETGIVVVPIERLSVVLAAAEGLQGKDRRFESELSSGAEFGAIAARLGHL